MSTLWELLFDGANRRLRKLGLIGVLIGLPLILYVEIPVETAAVQSELQNIGRSVLKTVHQHQQQVHRHSSPRGRSER